MFVSPLARAVLTCSIESESMTLARTYRASPATLTRTRVETGSIKCAAKSRRAAAGFDATYDQYRSLPKAYDSRLSVIPLTGVKLRVTAKTQIKMNPKMNVGRA
jgi:hypothetical protein